MFNCQFQPSLYFCRNRFSSFLGLAQAAPSVSRPPLSPPSWETTGTGRPTLKSTTRHVPYIYSSWKINQLRPYKSSKAPYTYTYSSWKIKHTQTLQKLKESHWLVIAVQFLTGYTPHDHCVLFPRICCTKLPLQFISNRFQQDYVHFFQEGNFDTYHL